MVVWAIDTLERLFAIDVPNPVHTPDPALARSLSLSLSRPLSLSLSLSLFLSLYLSLPLSLSPPLPLLVLGCLDGELLLLTDCVCVGAKRCMFVCNGVESVCGWDATGPKRCVLRVGWL